MMDMVIETVPCWSIMRSPLLPWEHTSVQEAHLNSVLVPFCNMSILHLTLTFTLKRVYQRVIQLFKKKYFFAETTLQFFKEVCLGHGFQHTNFHINSLWPSDAIWPQRSWSTLAQVMACCLMAPSHYLNQCWLTISNAQCRIFEGNFTKDTSTINQLNEPENYFRKISFKFSRGQWVMLNLLVQTHSSISFHQQANWCWNNSHTLDTSLEV